MICFVLVGLSGGLLFGIVIVVYVGFKEVWWLSGGVGRERRRKGWYWARIDKYEY
jgi:hypothetical protein